MFWFPWRVAGWEANSAYEWRGTDGRERLLRNRWFLVNASLDQPPCPELHVDPPGPSDSALCGLEGEGGEDHTLESAKNQVGRWLSR